MNTNCVGKCLSYNIKWYSMRELTFEQLMDGRVLDIISGKGRGSIDRWKDGKEIIWLHTGE